MWTGRGHADGVERVELAGGDGEHLVLSRFDRSIKAWRGKSGELRLTVTGHTVVSGGVGSSIRV